MDDREGNLIIYYSNQDNSSERSASNHFTVQEVLTKMGNPGHMVRGILEHNPKVNPGVAFLKWL